MKEPFVFRKGDKVYTMKNQSWGLEAMTVESVNWVNITCIHPELGKGAFPPEDLKLSSKISNGRKLKLHKVKNREDELLQEIRKLFPK